MCSDIHTYTWRNQYRFLMMIMNFLDYAPNVLGLRHALIVTGFPLTADYLLPKPTTGVHFYLALPLRSSGLHTWFSFLPFGPHSNSVMQLRQRWRQRNCPGVTRTLWLFSQCKEKPIWWNRTVIAYSKSCYSRVCRITPGENTESCAFRLTKLFCIIS